MTGATVLIPVDGDAFLGGDLATPHESSGIVVFAHGSGSSRASPRNRLVAQELHRSGVATVLVDLLTAEEERADARTGEHRFDIALLARRVERVVEWVGEHPGLCDLPLGLFGASTGAAAALVVAARRPDRVTTVVSRGGRPDLAGDALGQVSVPTLLIVGSHDLEVLEMNRTAARDLSGEARIEIVERATHLFEEPGALEQVASLAAGWFSRHLRPTGAVDA